MAKILINALASQVGGGETYLRNVLPRLSSWAHLHEFSVLLPSCHTASWVTDCQSFLSYVSTPSFTGAMERMWWEQTTLREVLSREKSDLLVSLGNFALLSAPIPQLLFCRNELYFSDYFKKDLWKRQEWLMLLGHYFKTWFSDISLRSSASFVVPTNAMASHLLRRGISFEEIAVLPFGFDLQVFQEDLEVTSANALNNLTETIKLLYVSHYNYFRNFETLLLAIPLVKRQIDKPLKIILTTKLEKGKNYGGYKTDEVAKLIAKLGIEDELVMLGAVDYGQLSHLYQSSDVFVCPSYAESFGHTMIEAMANGLPVVAANLPTHREVCENAALYFDVFNECELADQVVRVLQDRPLKQNLMRLGKQRAKLFSWDEHVFNLMQLIEKKLKA